MAREEWKLSEPPRRIAALPARRHKPAGVGGHVGARFVDDADDAQRHAHARDRRGRWAASIGQHRADRDRAAPPRRRGPRPSPRRACRRASAGRAWRPRAWRCSAASRSCRLAARIALLCRADARRPLPERRGLRLGLARASGRRRRARRSAPGRASRRFEVGFAPVCSAAVIAQHQIVAMDHLVAATVAEDGLDFTAFVAGDGAGVVARIGRQAARQLAAVLGRARSPRRRARSCPRPR